jgi:hypothetical protein
MEQKDCPICHGKGDSQPFKFCLQPLREKTEASGEVKRAVLAGITLSDHTL